MSFLETLAQLVSDIHPDNSQSPPQNEQIVVTGAQPSGTQDNTPAPNFGNSTYINEADAANANAPEHKGMFGVKGTLRDVLGLIGDAFLVQSGNKSIYDVKRQQERESDALTGFTHDPLAAMERLSRVNAGASEGMFDKYQKNMNDYAQVKSLNDYRADQTADRAFTNINQSRQQLMRLIANGKTPDQRRAIAFTYGPLLAKQAGVGVEDLGLNPNMTDDDLQAFAGGDMTVNQVVQLPFTERRVAASEKNAEAHEYNAHKPPRPPAPKSVTNVQTYVGEDGYQYTQRSDGTVVKSPTKVRPPKSGNGRRSVAVPSSPSRFTIKSVK